MVPPARAKNDLRLIGEVMRILHEQPVISVSNGTNGEIAQLQIVPHPLNLDNLNHIWSTQGDTAYRLSVAYEMALAPIPLTEAVERSSLVGEIRTRGRPLSMPRGFGNGRMVQLSRFGAIPYLSPYTRRAHE